MKHTDKYIGLDVHKDTITVAIAEGAITACPLSPAIEKTLKQTSRLVPAV